VYPTRSLQGLASAVEETPEVTASKRRSTSEALMTPGQVAEMFRVHPITVTRWARAGKLTEIRTAGGHRRYRAEEVASLLAGAEDA
jgi:excisionase family DNA binding protein